MLILLCRFKVTLSHNHTLAVHNPNTGCWIQWSLRVLCVIQVIGSSMYADNSDLGHWGLSAPNSREVRFTEHNDLAKFYQVAKEVGILVIVRPGYVIIRVFVVHVCLIHQRIDRMSTLRRLAVGTLRSSRCPTKSDARYRWNSWLGHQHCWIGEDECVGL